jgi:hypothetical protein
VGHDQAIASTAGQKSPHPLKEDAYPEIGCGEELDVDSRPNEPREESAEVDFAGLQNGKALPDYRHVPFVKVAKRTR